MNKIEVSVINQGHKQPINMMMFIAGITQRGHKIASMGDLTAYYEQCMSKAYTTASSVAAMPHGAIHRFAPVTLAIVGGSRRLLAQLRTHGKFIEWVSGSLQYSDFSSINPREQFVVPYEILDKGQAAINNYLNKCESDLKYYSNMIQAGFDRDTAGYSMNQGLRNVLVATAPREAWMHLIKTRICRRNTTETAYVAALIWEALYDGTEHGDTLYKHCGPECMYRGCEEGHMTCARPISRSVLNEGNPARVYIDKEWPLLAKDI